MEPQRPKWAPDATVLGLLWLLPEAQFVLCFFKSRSYLSGDFCCSDLIWPEAVSAVYRLSKYSSYYFYNGKNIL